ncbi:MAG: ParA family protein [Anaerolineae bacterium]|nr:ParA family protein [Anaerolineae bacterium]
MTHIISIANQKGGVGKTTTTTNLGVVLARMKKKTMLIDLDPQGALSAGLGIKVTNDTNTIYEVIMDEDIQANQAIQPVQAYLDVIPADNDLAAAPIELMPELRREFVLRNALNILEGWYDYILIDCPPSLNLLTVNALCVSTGIIIPVQCEYFAIRVVNQLIDSIERTRERMNPNLKLLGILPTMYSTGTIHSREVLEEMHTIYGDKVFNTVIHKSIRFAEATVANKSIAEYAGKHKGAEAYEQLAKMLIDITENTN